MSLINEALKKAQKLRTGDPVTIAPMPGSTGNTRITKRSEPRSTQQLVLIAAGALVLIVLSVVATFWFVNRTPEPKPAVKPVAVKPAEPAVPSPTIVAPAIKSVVAPETPPTKAALPPVVVKKEPAVTPPVPPAAPPPAPVAQTPKPVVEAPTPVLAPVAPPPAAAARAVATETAPPAAAPPVATPLAETPAPLPLPLPSPPAATGPIPTDPRVHAFVDAVKVAGIRSSGGDSRVLMNDRVFRVNDIVDRNLGIRLTKVEASALTFTDSNGAVYVKNF